MPLLEYNLENFSWSVKQTTNKLYMLNFGLLYGSLIIKPKEAELVTKYVDIVKYAVIWSLL